eukprot:COSAG05_NODE_148_length_16365_cov_76.419218_5_plen_185_part_00
MHGRKQAILTRSDPIPSLRLGIDTSKRTKAQQPNSPTAATAQQPASQPAAAQRCCSASGYQLRGPSPGVHQGPPHVPRVCHTPTRPGRAPWQMPGARMAKKMPPNLASGLKRTKASEELERVRGWVKAAIQDSGSPSRANLSWKGGPWTELEFKSDVPRFLVPIIEDIRGQFQNDHSGHSRCAD